MRREPEIPDMAGLPRLLKGRVCVLGVGNRDRGDDGCGSIIAEHLANGTGVCAFDAGMVPENYLEKAARLEPDTVVIIDAVNFGGHPGEARLLDAGVITAGGLSSHALSLRMAVEYLKERSNTDVVILAVQPSHLGYGKNMSEEVLRTVGILKELLEDVIAK